MRCNRAPGAEALADADASSYFNLGTYSRTVTTKNSEALTWFNRGLIWSYAFNHQEAVACFEQAIALDPTFPMAHWGIAYALGPNYNKPWGSFDEDELGPIIARGYQAASKAAQYAKTAAATPMETALIEALRHRYPLDGLPPTSSNSSPQPWDAWNHEYARQMRIVYKEWRDDLDVVALFVDALMNLTPWQLWDNKGRNPEQGSSALEAKSTLENALAMPRGTQHPGLLHLWIHLMELSSNPEEALDAANHLRTLVPDAGHLAHMPSHIDVLCGRYQQAIDANSAAILADEKYVAEVGTLNFYTLYRCHNYHFRIYAAMLCGQSQVAINTARELESTISTDLLRVESPPMADWLEGFLSTSAHAYVRFGCWETILELPFPEDKKLFCNTTATLHYARGLAYAALGRVDEAREEQYKFHDAEKRVPRSRTIFNNTCRDILKVASFMLGGEIQYRRGNTAEAYKFLWLSIDHYDSLPYDEPWGFMQPVRHALGALLLEQGLAEQAMAEYKADLGLDLAVPRSRWHPNNVWALEGYHECLVRTGRTEEARYLSVKLEKALALADVPIRSSCFCRLTCID
ncbi:TPR domain protein [Cryphonectria parasitica EP155]|uniref:TPR domain protein n=1 Tax=Cryphonectria parasitica (strain ATCC 38755 / EP155) TaxID=660469 RepID=A0A9P5CK34_CRYP1|nr:TPR domain protein [Cryphonectria parasitica EP155]KAF3761643.1 TPR domain protein [Cryphonectria parasitica EP155]